MCLRLWPLSCSSSPPLSVRPSPKPCSPAVPSRLSVLPRSHPHTLAPSCPALTLTRVPPWQARPLARAFSSAPVARKGQSTLQSRFILPRGTVPGGSHHACPAGTPRAPTRARRADVFLPLPPSRSSAPRPRLRSDCTRSTQPRPSLDRRPTLPHSTTGPCRRADFVQELYLKELRAYKPKPAVRVPAFPSTLMHTRLTRHTCHAGGFGGRDQVVLDPVGPQDPRGP